MLGPTHEVNENDANNAARELTHPQPGSAADLIYNIEVKNIPNGVIQEVLWAHGAADARVVATWDGGGDVLSATMYAYQYGDEEREIIGDADGSVICDCMPEFDEVKAELLAGHSPWVAYRVSSGRFELTESVGREEVDYIVRAKKLTVGVSALAEMRGDERIEIGRLICDLVQGVNGGAARVALASALAAATGATSAEDAAWRWMREDARRRGTQAVKALVKDLRAQRAALLTQMRELMALQTT